MHRIFRRGITPLEIAIGVATLLIIIVLVPVLWRRYANESHDIRRVGAVTELQNALKNSYLAHGSYPVVVSGEPVVAESMVVSTLVNDFFLVRTDLPVDPESPKYDITYRSDGKSYLITFCQVRFVQRGWEKGCANNVTPISPDATTMWSDTNIK